MSRPTFCMWFCLALCICVDIWRVVYLQIYFQLNLIFRQEERSVKENFFFTFTICELMNGILEQYINAVDNNYDYNLRGHTLKKII